MTKAVKILAKLRPILPDFRDVHVYGGAALIGLGAGLAWRPLGFVALGAVLVYLGLRRGAR